MTLEDLEKLEREASPAPWSPNSSIVIWEDELLGMSGTGPSVCLVDEDDIFDEEVTEAQAQRDAELIAAMRNALPKLLAVVRAVQDAPCRHPADVDNSLCPVCRALADLE